MNQEQTNSLTPLYLVYRKRKSILIVAMIMAGLAAIFTMPYFIQPSYESETILYPPFTNSNKFIIQGSSRFGSDKEIDEQIQILKSSEVRDSIIKKYNLTEHYDIDTTEKIWTYHLYKIFDDNTRIDRTRYNSISISVDDTDPQMAADMANDIVKFGDGVKNKIIKKNLNTAYEALNREQSLKIKEVDSIATNINNLKNEHVFSEIPYGLKTDLEKIKDQMLVRELMYKSRSDGNYTLLELLFDFESKLNQLKDLQENYSQAYIDFISPVPESYIVSHAQVSFKKVHPQRTVIVLMTFFGCILISSAYILFFEKFLPDLKLSK